jgi:hypothetical protein
LLWLTALAAAVPTGSMAAASGAAHPNASKASKKSKAKTKSSKKKAAAPDFDPHLPILGTRLAEFPPGPGKASADRGCVFCHSVDIVAQQRLTEKQWGAEVTKMTNWGADVPPDKREELIAYLARNFGPDAPQYDPVVTRPVGK